MPPKFACGQRKSRKTSCKPTAAKAPANKPAAAVSKPVASIALTGKPVASKAPASEPVAGKTPASEPVADKAPTSKPVANKPAVSRTVASKTAISKPVLNKSALSKLAASESVSHKTLPTEAAAGGATHGQTGRKSHNRGLQLDHRAESKRTLSCKAVLPLRAPRGCEDAFPDENPLRYIAVSDVAPASVTNHISCDYRHGFADPTLVAGADGRLTENVVAALENDSRGSNGRAVANACLEAEHESLSVLSQREIFSIFHEVAAPSYVNMPFHEPDSLSRVIRESGPYALDVQHEPAPFPFDLFSEPDSYQISATPAIEIDFDFLRTPEHGAEANFFDVQPGSESDPINMIDPGFSA